MGEPFATLAAPEAPTATASASAPASAFAADSPFVGTRVEPRPYQDRISRKAIAMFAGEHRDRQGRPEPAARSVMIESPTGSGKTVMGLAVAREMQRRYGLRVGWVAMRRNLLAQAAEENARHGFDVEIACISMFEREPPPVDMLVVDEAQHDAAASMASLHGALRPRFILGLTATPFRTDKVRLCFDKVITDAGIHQLIQDGYLSPYRHYTVPEFSPEAVAECYLREPPRWGKSVVFFHRLAQCLACCARLNAGGVRAEVVTAQSDRERQLSQFSRGEIDVLLSMAILTEGFDCPSLRTVFCRPSGRGCTIQMAGRVFRTDPGEPVKQVVQCARTGHPMLRTASACEQYLWSGEGWRSLAVNPRIAAIGLRTLQLVAGTDVQLPEFVMKRKMGGRAAVFRGGDTESEDGESGSV